MAGAATDILAILHKQANAVSATVRMTQEALLKAGDVTHQRVQGFFGEVMRMLRAYEQNGGIGIRPASINLAIDIDAAADSGGSDEYKASTDEDFIAHSVAGYAALLLPQTDTAQAATLGTNVVPTERLALKMMNCTVQLKDKDGKWDIGQNRGFNLYSLFKNPRKFGGPDYPHWLIPSGRTVEATFTLGDTTAATIGTSTRYGVEIDGSFLLRLKANG